MGSVSCFGLFSMLIKLLVQNTEIVLPDTATPPMCMWHLPAGDGSRAGVEAVLPSSPLYSTTTAHMEEEGERERGNDVNTIPVYHT